MAIGQTSQTAVHASTAARFIVAGGAGALLLFCLAYLFARAELPPFIAGALAHAISFLAVYTVHRNWTFGGAVSHGHALPRYFAVQLASAGVSGLAAVAASGLTGNAPLYVAAAVTIIASTFSYFASRFWAFAAKPATGH